METTDLSGNWEEQKGRLKQKFTALTKNDLLFEEGKKEEIIKNPISGDFLEEVEVDFDFLFF